MLPLGFAARSLTGSSSGVVMVLAELLVLFLCIVASVAVLVAALESSVVHGKLLIETLVVVIYTRIVVNSYLMRAAEVINDASKSVSCLSPSGALLAAVYVFAVTTQLAINKGFILLTLLRELLKFDEVIGWKEAQVYATSARAAIPASRTIVLRLTTRRQIPASAFDSSAPLPSLTTLTLPAELATVSRGSSLDEANCATLTGSASSSSVEAEDECVTLTGSASSPLQDDALAGQASSDRAEEADCATLAGSASSTEAGVEVGSHCVTLAGLGSILSSTDGAQKDKASGEDEKVVEEKEEVEAMVEKEIVETVAAIPVPVPDSPAQDEPAAIDEQEHSDSSSNVSEVLLTPVLSTAELLESQEASAVVSQPEYLQVKRTSVYTPKGQTYRENKSDLIDSDSDDETDTDDCPESNDEEEYTAEEKFRLVRLVRQNLRCITSLPASFINRPPPAPTSERPPPMEDLGLKSKKVAVVGGSWRSAYRNTALIPDSDDEDEFPGSDSEDECTDSEDEDESEEEL